MKDKKKHLIITCDSFISLTYLDKMSASIEASAIIEYFKRKSIFITGATG